MFFINCLELLFCNLWALYAEYYHRSCILDFIYFLFNQVTTSDGRYLHCFEVGHSANSIAPTPEAYGTGAEDGFYSMYLESYSKHKIQWYFSSQIQFIPIVCSKTKSNITI